MKRRVVLRIEKPEHGTFSGRTFEMREAAPEDDPTGGVNIAVWLSYDGGGAQLSGIGLDLERTVALRDALNDYLRDGAE